MLFLQVSNTTGVPFSVRAIAQKEFSFLHRNLLSGNADTDLQGTPYGDVWRGCCAPMPLVVPVSAFFVKGVTTMEEEIWKDVVGYESYYEISNRGNARRKTPKTKTGKCRMLKHTNCIGYKTVSLNVDGTPRMKYVHRLLAMAFIENPENKPQVNHINGVKSDNRLCNLEWVSAKENIQHAVATGLMTHDYCRGKSSLGGILTEESVLYIRQVYREGKILGGKIKKGTIQQLATKFGVSYRCICSIAYNRNWAWLKDDAKLSA